MARKPDLAAQLIAVTKSKDPYLALARIAQDNDPHVVLRTLASLQDGQFCARQAYVLGLSRGSVEWLVESAEVIRLRRGVGRFRFTPGDPDPDVTGWLVCWPHGVISWASAARHHALSCVPAPPQPELTLPWGVRCNAAGLTIHRSRSLPPADRLLVGAVAYTTMARTVCDLADPDDLWRTLAILDDAVARGATPGWIHDVACRLVNGRAGLRPLVDATAPGSAAVFRSFLERASGCIYRASHLPEPEWNVPVYDDDGRIGVVDALWRAWYVISEKEGLRFHTTPAQRRKDAERFNRLLNACFIPRRFTWQDVVQRPVYVAVTVAQALARAGAQVDLAVIPRHIEVPAFSFRR